MKKTIVLQISILLVILSFFSCADKRETNTGSEEKEQTTKSNETVEIVKVDFSDFSIYSDDTEVYPVYPRNDEHENKFPYKDDSMNGTTVDMAIGENRYTFTYYMTEEYSASLDRLGAILDIYAAGDPRDDVPEIKINRETGELQSFRIAPDKSEKGDRQKIGEEAAIRRAREILFELLKDNGDYCVRCSESKYSNVYQCEFYRVFSGYETVTLATISVNMFDESIIQDVSLVRYNKSKPLSNIEIGFDREAFETKVKEGISKRLNCSVKGFAYVLTTLDGKVAIDCDVELQSSGFDEVVGLYILPNLK